MKVTLHAAMRFEERGTVNLTDTEVSESIARAHEQADPRRATEGQKRRAILGALVQMSLERTPPEVVFDVKTEKPVQLVPIFGSGDLIALCREGIVVTCFTKDMVESAKNTGLFKLDRNTRFPLTASIGEQQMSSDPKATKRWAEQYFAENPDHSIKTAAKQANHAGVNPHSDVLRVARQEARAKLPRPAVQLVSIEVPKPKPQPSTFTPPIPLIEVSPMAVSPSPTEPTPAEQAILAQARVLLSVMREHNVATCTLDLNDESSKPKLDMSFDFRRRVSGSYDL